MTEKHVPTRDEIDPKHTRNAESVFESAEAWEAEVTEVDQAIEAISEWQGRLSEGPAVLLNALTDVYALNERVDKIYVYAAFSAAVDRTNQAAVERAGRGQGVYSQALAAVSFVEPELLDIGRQTLVAWADEEPGLVTYRHYLDNLFRKQAHVRSAEPPGARRKHGP